MRYWVQENTVIIIGDPTAVASRSTRDVEPGGQGTVECGAGWHGLSRGPVAVAGPCAPLSLGEVITTRS
jgi:hypothetical protein